MENVYTVHLANMPTTPKTLVTLAPKDHNLVIRVTTTTTGLRSVRAFLPAVTAVCLLLDGELVNGLPTVVSHRVPKVTLT